jgi:hypothetical protein
MGDGGPDWRRRRGGEAATWVGEDAAAWVGGGCGDACGGGGAGALRVVTRARRSPPRGARLGGGDGHTSGNSPISISLGG